MTPRTSSTAPTVTAPLSDLTVVEYGDDLAAAFCGKHFADLGATVLLARQPHLGDEDAALRAYLDNAKRPLSATPVRIDVAIVPHGETAAPATITVHISDFGETGPQAAWGGGALVAQASSGLLDLIGDPSREPVALGGHQIDDATGWAAFTGAQIALAGIELGNGPAEQTVRVSRLEVAAYIEWKGRVYVQAGNELVRGERSGPLVLRCSDGFFGLYYRASDWDRVLSVFNDPALREPPFDTHPGRLQHPVELVAQLERTTLQRTQAELYEALQRMRVPAGPVMTADHLVRSQQFVAREFLVPLEVDGEHAVQPAVPVTFNGQRPGGEEVQR